MGMSAALRRGARAAAVLIMVCPMSGAALDEREGGERAALAEALSGSLAAGYKEKNVDKFLSVYLPEARIVNYIYGTIDRETLGNKTLDEFADLLVQIARVDVLEATITGEDAQVLINFAVSGVLADGRRTQRNDRYYLQMRKGAQGWKIQRQGYRPDYLENSAPHGRPR